MLKKLLFVIVGLVASIGMAIAAININTATEQELDVLPGVGPAKAKAIVEYRKANGNFKSIEDIKHVKGIGDKTFEDLKGQIAVSGATTVPAAAPAKAAKDTKEVKSAASSAAPKADKKAKADEKAAKAEASSAAAKPEKAAASSAAASVDAKADKKAAKEAKAAEKKAKQEAAAASSKATK